MLGRGNAVVITMVGLSVLVDISTVFCQWAARPVPPCLKQAPEAFSSLQPAILTSWWCPSRLLSGITMVVDWLVLFGVAHISSDACIATTAFSKRVHSHFLHDSRTLSHAPTVFRRTQNIYIFEYVYSHRTATPLMSILKSVEV